MACKYADGVYPFNELSLSPANSGGWFLNEDFNIVIVYKSTVHNFCVPRNFHHNLGSVPTLLEFLVASEDYPIAFTVHDFLYMKGYVSRREADILLYYLIKKDAELCENEESIKRGILTPKIAAPLCWLACHLFASHKYTKAEPEDDLKGGSVAVLKKIKDLENAVLEVTEETTKNTIAVKVIVTVSSVLCAFSILLAEFFLLFKGSSR